MFFRRKTSGGIEYVQIVKNERIDGKPRQSVVATVGRVDELTATGTLDREVGVACIHRLKGS